MFRNIRFILMLTAIHCCCFSSTGLANANLQSAIVKIYTSKNNPSYINPWDSDGPISFSGSGVVIAGNRILTNAHVVCNATFIQVRAHGKAERFRAKVAAVSHEADLALLTVEEPSFFDTLDPIELGDVPPGREFLYFANEDTDKIIYFC